MTPDEHAAILRPYVRQHVPGGGEQHLEALLELASDAWQIQDRRLNGWRLWHVCGWTSNDQDGARSMGDLARWIGNHECASPEIEPNRPIGFVTRKPWSQIPAGWFVRPARSTDWWEVLRTWRAGTHQQVTLRGPDGREGTWPRAPRDEVACRRGTNSPTSVENALRVLGEGVEIIEDEA